MERGGEVPQKELEDTIFVGNATDLDFFASQKLIFIGMIPKTMETYDSTVSFMKVVDAFAAKQFRDEPRYSLVLERLRSIHF